MKNLYYVRTNAYDMILNDDGEIRRCFFNDSKYLPIVNDDKKVFEILKAIEDDSSWEQYEESIDVIIGNHFETRIIAKCSVCKTL